MKAAPPSPPHALVVASRGATTCGARTRGGKGCANPAGFRTDHLGDGKCFLHGGLTPIRHGRYSTIQRPALRELIERHAARPDPLDTQGELALARGFLEDWINRASDREDALLAWYARDLSANRPLPPDQVAALRRVLDDWVAERVDLAGEPEEQLEPQQRELVADATRVLEWLRLDPATAPDQVPDLADAVRLVSEVTKIVERIERARAANAISRGDLLRVMTEMGRVVEAHVRDLPTQQKIREGWLQIRVAA